MKLMIKRILEWLGLAPQTRLVPVPEPVRVLDEGELAAAFAVPADNALWLAVNQVLRGYLENAKSQVSLPENALQPGALTHVAGGMEWMAYIQAELHWRWQQANGRYAPSVEAKPEPKAAKPANTATTEKVAMPVSQPAAPAPEPGVPSDDDLLNG